MTRNCNQRHTLREEVTLLRRQNDALINNGIGQNAIRSHKDLQEEWAHFLLKDAAEISRIKS